MNNNSFLKHILFALTVVFLASCDRDFNSIGTDIIGADNFAFGTPKAYDVVAFNQNSGVVQSSNLPTNALGIYYNPAFGTTTANFATQLELSTVNPTIDATLLPVIESVVLTIPYFSTKTGLKDDGVSGIYELDSIYGPKTSKLKLGVYESGYFMRDLDPSTQETQQYYTNQNSLFDNVKGPLLNNEAVATQNDEFIFSDAELTETVTATDGTVTTTRTAPGMKLNLDTTFFKNKIIDAPSGKLTTNDVFKNYFRGLYFKVEKSGAADTNLAMLNFKGGTITIKYKENTSATVKTRVDKSIILNLTGNSVNLLQNDYLSSYTDGIASPNLTDGDPRLFLKGGEGSMAVINLFGGQDLKGLDSDGNLTNIPNHVSDDLDELRANSLLINDASLTFTIDNNSMSNALTSEPNRIYLYDLNNKKQLTDYTTDLTTRTAQKYNKYIHGGIIEKVAGKGTQYKIKLTNHIRSLIKNDTVTNVRLGLVVTENINDVSNKKLKNSFNLPGILGGNPFEVKYLPTSSVMNPLGTILYGSNPSVPEDKKLKFQIYYTKPN
ncbi:DUF4270 domain-containing protein [Flavobacterium psychrotolerans]|uniref:DUF4270 domain-containing protein n=1 Tax=Flavobacterium psychrotolerans TaxID=2169410 RepID=A0A2U1JK27_9FLAO|nr:DUF4270 domain-containing protein [Flavobacterium psychrotolerans]PWA05223.1 DUF4270 domain-containing protein [Flavobacterium psychrotolerans]